MRGWRQYLAQPVLPASLAYVLLYFNAVLAPGGLMTTYLTQQGTYDSVLLLLLLLLRISMSLDFLLEIGEDRIVF